MANDTARLRANLRNEVDSASIYEALTSAEKDEKTARARMLAFLGQRFGSSFVLPTLARNEAADSAQYDGQADAVAAGLPGDERAHARVVQGLAEGEGGLDGQSLAKLEGRHRGGGGNTLRASVLGANDGLVSNLSLVMGVAGAAAEGKTILALHRPVATVLRRAAADRGLGGGPADLRRRAPDRRQHALRRVSRGSASAPGRQSGPGA